MQPCPFCGGIANVIGYKNFYSQCTECGVATGFYSTIEETTEAWNTRKPMERILEQLEERHKFYENRFAEMSGTDRDVEDWGSIKSYADAIEIVNQVEKKYNSGWIPVSERYPENDKYILISFENFSLPVVGRYEEDENGGAFFVGDDDISCVSSGLIVNAWRLLPAAYKDGMTMSNADMIRSMTDEQLADEMLKFSDVCEQIGFCHNDILCSETLDRGELIEPEMCKRCLLNWLRKEVKE